MKNNQKSLPPPHEKANLTTLENAYRQETVRPASQVQFRKPRTEIQVKYFHNKM